MNNKINFTTPDTSRLTNIEVEQNILGGILIDCNAIHRIAEIIPNEAFSVTGHQEVWKAIKTLYKREQNIDLLTVASHLEDKGKLSVVGGRSALARLVDATVSAVNIDAMADLLVEKYIRRQLQKLSHEILENACETETPLPYVLEKAERKVLQITQLRKSEKKGYWNSIDEVAFKQLCKDLYDVEGIENSAQRDWSLKKLAKKWKFSNKKEFLDFHAKWLDSQTKSKTYSAKEYFQKYGNCEQNWLIPGFIPAESVIALYAGGGVGKTRLAFTLAKAACEGGTFAYEGTEFEPLDTLLIETDQGPRTTAKLLEMQDLYDTPRLNICDEWSVGEFGKLRKMLDDLKPKLVIVDSLTSISASSIYCEKDTEYARPLVRLRHLAKEYGCTFLVIHHANASGDMRGSRAIKDTVDEVYKFSNQQNELGEFNMLTIEKTRARGPAKYKFTYNDETWGWTFGGRIEDDGLGINKNTSVMNQCLKMLQKNKGIPYQAVELAEALDLNLEAVRKALRRAALEGLCNNGRSSTNRRALVYYIGKRKELLSNITSGTGSDPVPDSRPRRERSDSNEYKLPGKLGQENEKSNFENNSDISSQFPSNGTKQGSIADSETDTLLGKQLGRNWDVSEKLVPDVVSETNENSVSKEEVKAIYPTCDLPGYAGNSINEYLESSSDDIPIHPSFEDNETNSMRITGMTGTWSVEYEVDAKHIHIKYSCGDKKGIQEEFIQIHERLTYQIFREKVKSAIWELERVLIGNRQFRVKVWSRDVNELEPKWIYGCTLVSVPILPNTRTYFSFATADGQVLTKFDLTDFKLLEKLDE